MRELGRLWRHIVGPCSLPRGGHFSCPPLLLNWFQKKKDWVGKKYARRSVLCPDPEFNSLSAVVQWLSGKKRQNMQADSLWPSHPGGCTIPITNLAPWGGGYQRALGGGARGRGKQHPRGGLGRRGGIRKDGPADEGTRGRGGLMQGGTVYVAGFDGGSIGEPTLK